MKLTEVLGTVTYQVREGKITHDFVFPDFQKVKLTKLEKSTDIDAAALFSLWLEHAFTCQQKIKHMIEKRRPISHEDRVKYQAVTEYLENAMDYLTGFDSVSLELVNRARVQICAGVGGPK